MDPLTTVGAGLAILGSRDVLIKILGPSADYIGGEAKNLVEKCNINLTGVFERAKEKLGSRLDDPGAVSPRVLRHVYEDGRFAEDEIVVEYYGGLLAGSKTKNGKDDQALPYLAKVQQMSTYQLRIHFLLYYELLRLHKVLPINLALENECHKAALVFPHEMIIAALETEKGKYAKLLGHGVAGLNEQGLVGHYFYGNLVGHVSGFNDAPANAVFLTPTFLGAEMFMWALGIESPSGHDFFNISIEEVDKPIPIVGSAISKAADKQ